MSDAQNDPSGNTEAFQAFVRSAPADESGTAGGRSTVGIAIAVIAAAIIVAAAIWYFAAR